MDQVPGDEMHQLKFQQKRSKIWKHNCDKQNYKNGIKQILAEGHNAFLETQRSQAISLHCGVTINWNYQKTIDMYIYICIHCIHKSSLADFHQKNILFQNGKTFIEIQSQRVDHATKQLRKRVKKGFIQVDQSRFFCFIPVLRKQHGLRRMTQQEATFRSLCALVGWNQPPGARMQSSPPG